MFEDTEHMFRGALEWVGVNAPPPLEITLPVILYKAYNPCVYEANTLPEFSKSFSKL